MATKAEKERKKFEQDKMQALLNGLLREEDNKYCADCDAKGPRWASWNLGVFLCIRCAGIHRNLGVHVSKVRSVNLDSWSPEQVAYMQHIGNSVARAVYEAHLPDNFRRPQSDSSVQAFIQAKYEQKRYIMKDWVTPKIDSRHWPTADDSGTAGADRKKRNKSSSAQTPVIGNLQPPPATGQAPEQHRQRAPSPKLTTATAKKSGALADLVDLAPPHPPPHVASSPNLLANGGQSSSIGTGDLLGLMSPPQQQPVVPQGTAELPPTLSEAGPNPSQVATTPSSATSDITLLSAGDAGTKKTTTDILALYGSGTSIPQGGAMGPNPNIPAMPQAQGGYFMPPAQQPPNPMGGMPPNYPQPSPNSAFGQFAGVQINGYPQGGFGQPQGMSPAYGGQPQGFPPQTYPPQGAYSQPMTGAPYQGYGQQGMPYPSAPGMTNQFAGMQLSGQQQPGPGANTLATNLWR